MVHSKARALESMNIDIKSLPFEDLQSELLGLGLKKFRADQIHKWLYINYAHSFNEMTNITITERKLLTSVFFISTLNLLKTETSKDGTIKYLFELDDKHTIESVLIPNENRLTLCISSQVGCPLACRFCLTGSKGFQRNLKANEIVNQVVEVSRLLKKKVGQSISNIVLMGMGEPLANFSEVATAIGIITSGRGCSFSPRRVTLSTAGLAPEIKALAKSGLKVNLAVSLNATTDEVRDSIMPINIRYSIKELLAACKSFPLEPRRRITFEYVMIKGVNDSVEDAERLVKLLKGIRCKLNLIPFNPFQGSNLKRPDDATIQRFQKIVLKHHYTAPVRESRGRDISAACGQLKEREMAAAYNS